MHDFIGLLIVNTEEGGISIAIFSTVFKISVISRSAKVVLDVRDVCNSIKASRLAFENKDVGVRML